MANGDEETRDEDFCFPPFCLHISYLSFQKGGLKLGAHRPVRLSDNGRKAEKSSPQWKGAMIHLTAKQQRKTVTYLRSARALKMS